MSWSDTWCLRELHTDDVSKLHRFANDVSKLRLVPIKAVDIFHKYHEFHTQLAARMFGSIWSLQAVGSKNSTK